jgi:protein-disulfide isomerase
VNGGYEVRKSWILGAVAAAAILAGAGYLAFAPDGSQTTPVVATSTPATTTSTPATTPVTPVVPAQAPAEPAQTAATPTETVQTQSALTEPATAETVQGQPAQPEQAVLADATVQVELYPDERVLGSKDAPITLVEYASLTCPHCAAFSKEVMPQLRSEYIDKGQVRYVYRDFPLDGPGLQAAQVAQCVKDDGRYFALIDTFFKLQSSWAESDDVPGALAKIAALAGLDKGTVDKCIADEEIKGKIIARRSEAEEKFDVRSTPSFVINGQVVKGAQTIEMLQDIFKDMLPKG